MFMWATLFIHGNSVILKRTLRLWATRLHVCVAAVFELRMGSDDEASLRKAMSQCFRDAHLWWLACGTSNKIDCATPTRYKGSISRGILTYVLVSE